MDPSETSKTITEAVVSEVPVAGSALSLVVDLVWPEGPSLWEQIKEHVKALIGQSIAAYNLEQLTEEIQGLKNAIYHYGQLEAMDQKKDHLEAVATIFDTASPRYLAGDPAENLSCFWAFALLHLSVLKERSVVWNDSANHNQLRDASLIYAEYGRVGVSRAYNHRLRQVRYDGDIGSLPLPFGGSSIMYQLVYTDGSNELYNWVYDQSRNGAPNIPAEIHKALEKVKPYWENLASSTSTTLTSLFISQIEELEHKWSTTSEVDVKSLLSAAMGDNYQEFEKEYWPTQSVFHQVPSTSSVIDRTPELQKPPHEVWGPY